MNGVAIIDASNKVAEDTMCVWKNPRRKKMQLKNILLRFLKLPRQTMMMKRKKTWMSKNKEFWLFKKGNPKKDNKKT